MISLNEFATATERCDVRAIATFFRERAALGLAYDLRNDADRVLEVGGPDLAPTSVVRIAIHAQAVDVLAWMFSTDAITAIGQAAVRQALEPACAAAMRAASASCLDVLLSSAAMVELLSPDDQVDVVNDLFSGLFDLEKTDLRVVNVLIAHGANVNWQVMPAADDTALRRSARNSNAEVVDTLVRDGAFVVGSPIFGGSFCFDANVLQTLFDHGATWTSDQKTPMVWSAAYSPPATTRLWLERGFIDVDARAWGYRTPLMAVTWQRVNGEGGRQLALETARLLLAFGATIAFKDSRGRTALHYAVAISYPEVVRLLLDHGMDPNERSGSSGAGDTSLDCIHFEVIGRKATADCLRHLLEFGGDPFLPARNGSAWARLQESEDGRAFIATHPQWFASVVA